MTATRTAPAGMTVRDGETDPSCMHCLYFSGHTSWCPSNGKVKAVAPRRHNLYTMSAERIATEVIGRTIRVSLWEGVRFGKVERVENGRTVVRFPDGRWAYGPSGRITVR